MSMTKLPKVMKRMGDAEWACDVGINEVKDDEVEGGLKRVLDLWDIREFQFSLISYLSTLNQKIIWVITLVWPVSDR